MKVDDTSVCEELLIFPVSRVVFEAGDVLAIQEFRVLILSPRQCSLEFLKQLESFQPRRRKRPGFLNVSENR
jgi:hypothetical protein